MIAEAGLAALWLAAALALLQLGMGALALKPGGAALLPAVRPVAVAQGALAAIAFACLLLVFARTDLSVLLVAENSHSAKPWLYKVTGAWGNHEGSMLLWVTVLAIAGAAIAGFERALPVAQAIATLAAQAAIALGFYAFLLFASNPFARIDPAPADGLGLNPILQDPGLAFHPPTLYVGYVGLSVAFSFAVGALLTGGADARFARAMRNWVLAAWIFLTLGIVAGSYWAYYELGWGGWWFWDPVENASLMPWLAATALFHSATVLASRGALAAWTLMLAVVAFSMSMVGTFLVRSGILTSVHSFAVDPTRGAFILALLVLYIGGALALFGWRIGRVTPGAPFAAASREGGLVLNNLLLSVILGVVLIGTLYPLALEAATGEKLSVGPPYFNVAAGVPALLLVVAMAAGPLLRWRRDRLGDVARRFAVPAGAGALVFVALLVTGTAVMPAAGLSVAVTAGIGSVLPLWGRSLRRTPLATWGMVVAHLGIAVSLAGAACDAAFTRETLVALGPGESAEVGPYRITLRGVRPATGSNWTAVEALLIAKRKGGGAFGLHPQARSFANPPTETSESAIATRLDGQLYTVLGKRADGSRWQLRLWWKPFVTLIWGGGALVAAGGALSILGHWRRARRRRLAA